jgi:hypothetical protein
VGACAPEAIGPGQAGPDVGLLEPIAPHQRRSCRCSGSPSTSHTSLQRPSSPTSNNSGITSPTTDFRHQGEQFRREARAHQGVYSLLQPRLSVSSIGGVATATRPLAGAMAAGGDSMVVANGITSAIAAHVNANRLAFAELPLQPAQLAEMVPLIESGTISGRSPRRSCPSCSRRVVRPGRSSRRRGWA